MNVAYREESSEFDAICEELGKVLAEDFKNDRAFSFNQLLSSAPNPCLEITGPGVVGLPLSARDAQAIIKVAKQSSPGKQANAKDCKTWQVKADKIQFTNEEWPSFLQNTVAPAVLKGLGVEPKTATRLEFSRLLLFGPGSSLSRQGLTDSNPGFATILILLPSKHVGGEFRLSHDAQTHAVSIPPKSVLKTHIIGWYAGVTHETTPITSGYRLALLYNVIHTGSKKSIPRLPNMDPAVNRLKTALAKWLQMASQQETYSDNFVVSLLKGQYNVLNGGLGALSGRDAGLVSRLCAIGEDMGFVVFLGSVNYYIMGEGSNANHFDQIDERELNLENLVDTEGNPLTGTAVHQAWRLDDRHLIPKDPFAKLEPDFKDHEDDEFAGTLSYGSLSHSYKRTGVVLAHKDHVDAICFKRAGMNYALQKLESPTDPNLNENDRKTMLAMIRGVGVDSWEKPNDNRIYGDLVAHAFRWRSVEIWGAASVKYKSTAEFLDRQSLESAKTFFSFEDMLPYFTELLRKEQPLRVRIDFIALVRTVFTGNQLVDTWCQEETVQAYSQFTDPCKDDITLLLHMGMKHGIAFLYKVIIPSLDSAPRAFKFMIHFIDGLRHHKASIPCGISNKGQQAVGWNQLMDQCLNILIDQVDVTNKVSQGRSSFPANHVDYMYAEINGCTPVTRLMSVYEKCLSPRRDQPCEKITDLLLSIPGSPSKLFSDLYTPLLSKLGPRCRELKIDMAAPPLARLARTLVDLYFQHVLEMPSIHVAKIKKIGCGCKECDSVDRFILNTNMKQWSIRLKEDITQDHFKPRLDSAKGVLTYSIVAGNPPTLRILKLPEILVAQKWQERVPAAKTFLSYIGNDNTIARLMGDEYGDIQRVLQGLRPAAGFGVRKRKASSKAGSAGKRKKT